MAVSDVWKLNPPWASIYSFAVERPWFARPAAQVAWGTDVNLLYNATQSLADLPEGSAVLDVPTGTGVALRGVKPDQKLRYVAADISTAMLDRARHTAGERGVDIEAVQADAGALQFDDGEFDAVVSLTGLHCFSEPEKAISEFGRVLKSGGKLTLSWLRTDAGVRYAPLLLAGRAGGLIGPSATTGDVRRWLIAYGFVDIELEVSGAVAYVTALAA